MNWAGKRVLVTGATGFIGGRVCERLVLAGVPHVRALVHSMHRAARISRLPIELCRGSLLEPDSLRSATEGSTTVIHCGLSPARGIVTGTENLLKASSAAGVERFIHISTTAVYGLTPPPGCEKESAPTRITGDGYCDNKARAEKVVLKFCGGGVPSVILRPSIVYGPYSAWSTRLIENLRSGKIALIDGGTGVCNTTYVDNLVDAIFLAVENQRAVGNIFSITDGELVTWGQFIAAHVAMLDQKIVLPEISRQKVRALHQERAGIFRGSFRAASRVLRSRAVRQLLLQIPLTERAMIGAWQWLASIPEDRRDRIRARFGVRPQPPVSSNGTYVPDEVTLATETNPVFFNIDKAREILGYEPRVLFDQGIHLVEQWLRFANYL